MNTMSTAARERCDEIANVYQHFLGALSHADAQRPDRHLDEDGESLARASSRAAIAAQLTSAYALSNLADAITDQFGHGEYSFAHLTEKCAGHIADAIDSHAQNTAR